MRLPPIEAGAAESPWRRLRLGLAAVVWLASATAALAQSLENLTIRTASGSHAFAVEVVRTPEERAIGLMNRRFLPADRGMLFDFGEAAPVSMWMKNTYISLDMLFIRADGTIARIAQRTEPLSTRIVPSGEPVLSVLELNAGTAARIGARPGDKVEHPLFSCR
ncbi:Uncharacterized conserved membrane protein, UPF0127 family [Chelatococcus sambhunathii]|uniref:Uncharacterized conserved membrane protein, UPF0127 family n=1 Tax=Chelatococcus sambhunathii TaxID=363953 RepID=A0ABP2A0L0_9HYPH|nr:DUF192 domain-containing protein [Chelatococcus sambhunathii]CUA85998.1 Uncharacterized conserved membrane protein, UPF0127 family [Chelatococcus sambhunathii]